MIEKYDKNQQISFPQGDPGYPGPPGPPGSSGSRVCFKKINAQLLSHFQLRREFALKFVIQNYDQVSPSGSQNKQTTRTQYPIKYNLSSQYVIFYQLKQFTRHMYMETCRSPRGIARSLRLYTLPKANFSQIYSVERTLCHVFAPLKNPTELQNALKNA